MREELKLAFFASVLFIGVEVRGLLVLSPYKHETNTSQQQYAYMAVLYYYYAHEILCTCTMYSCVSFAPLVLLSSIEEE